MSARAAITFLTIVPLRPAATARPLRDAVVWFPVVGALVGAAAGGIRAGADPLLGADLATILALAAGVVLTGGLHHDGLADSADGLGPRTTERSLQAMRDSSTGAFGVLALIGWALVAWAALAPLDGLRGFTLLLAAGALGRAAAVIHAAVLAPARSDGLGADFTVTQGPALATTLLAVGIAVAALGPVAAGVSCAAGAAVVVLWTGLVRRRFGGRTGDTLGATVLLVELAAFAAARALA